MVFTCLKVRAVHFEVVESMSTSSFLMALDRFHNRRQHLRMLVSDRGTNFVGADEVLKRAAAEWNGSLTAGERQFRKVTWHFHPALGHHRNGVTERIIKEARKHLAMVLGKATLPLDVFTTVTVAVEAILNKRPLTRVSDDPRDWNALTPMDVLCPGLKAHSSDLIIPPAPAGAEDVRYAWQKARSLVGAFWKRWLPEYMSTLRERQKWLKTQPDPQVGHLVLLVDEVKARCDWKMARILETSGDGSHKRTVKVRTPNGRILERDVTKVVLLEFEGQE